MHRGQAEMVAKLVLCQMQIERRATNQIRAAKPVVNAKQKGGKATPRVETGEPQRAGRCAIWLPIDTRTQDAIRGAAISGRNVCAGISRYSRVVRPVWVANISILNPSASKIALAQRFHPRRARH
jgi:hypothetical protein